MAWPPFVQIVNGFYPKIYLGALRHPISIQRQGPTSPPQFDSSGMALSDWSDFITSAAAIQALRGTDVIRAGQDTTQLYVEVGLVFEPGVLANMRVLNLDNGSVYLIQSVENVLEMNEVLVLNCIALGSNQ